MTHWLFTYAPLAISVLAFLVSAFSLGWNIYRDVVMKPKLRVTFGVRRMINADGHMGPPFLSLSGTNLGPGQITCRMPTIKTKSSSLLRRLIMRPQYAHLVHDHRNPFCSKLPLRLNMAEDFNLVFPYDADCFLHARPTHVGVSDTFWRVHWAPRRELKEAIARYKADFPSGPTGRGDLKGL